MDVVEEAEHVAEAAQVTKPAMKPVDAAQECGPIVLHIGVEAHNWGIPQLVEAAKFAKAHGVDTICPKRADGTIKWYGTPAELESERAAVLAEGVGYLPMLYAYGPHFSRVQIENECHVLAEMMSVNGANHSVCVDMEEEWDGNPGAATYFCSLMRLVPGLLYVSTWANPLMHDWPVQALAPCVNAWVPQQYNNYLAAQEWQEVRDGETVIFPTVDLTQEFGANDPVAIAAKARVDKHQSLWIWEYGPAVSNPALLDKVIAAFKG